MNSPAIKNPPYLDFANHILYMGGNNKALLESWLYFLTKTHTFAVGGSYELATEQRFSKPVKYEAQITGVRSVEALLWIEINFDPKRHPPYHPVAMWKRPDPIPKKREPVWVVRVGLDEVFKGCELKAKAIARENATNPKTKIVGLLSPSGDYQYYK